MPTQRWENSALVAEVRWRRLALRCLVHVTRASWQIVLDSWQQDSSRIAQTECTHLPELLVHCANQWASMDVYDRKRGGFHSAASIAHKEAKAKMKGKKKEVTTLSQRGAQIVDGAHTKEKEDVACPRCDRELYVFNTASGPILRCRGWSLEGCRVPTVQEVEVQRVVLVAQEHYQDETMTHRIHLLSTTGRPRCKLWRQTQLWHKNSSPSGNFSINSISIFNINSSSCRRRQRILGKCGSTGDRWSMDTGTDRIGV